MRNDYASMHPQSPLDQIVGFDGAATAFNSSFLAPLAAKYLPEPGWINTAAIVIGALVTYLFVLKRRARRASNPRGLPTPPGPKKLPVVGNLFDLAHEDQVGIYYNMAKKYGDLVFLSVLGRDILIVNKWETARELFEKRSGNYSDRNDLPMINDLMGWDWSFANMRYGERWRLYRRTFHKQFQQSVAHIHWPTQLREAHNLLRRILHNPDGLITHLRHNAGSVIIGVVYGLEVADSNDQLLHISETALHGLAKAASPGAFLVDVLPFLKYVPAWMPGAGFQRKAKVWKEATLGMRDVPFEKTLKAIKDGKARQSMVSNLLGELDPNNEAGLEGEMEVIRGAAGLAYAGGAESVVSAISGFILAMILNPDVQRKAQEEVDRVVGKRLPDFGDRKSMPYTEALLKEVSRWHTVGPLGLPHMVTEDDEYRGYHIPANTTIMGFTWAILHDPIRYPEPEAFRPERFLDVDELKPELDPFEPLSTAFGYGRRICPGRYMAEAQVWISIVSILTCFDLSYGLDEVGKPVIPKPKFTEGMIRHPVPYKFTMVPRGEHVKNLIENTMDP